MGNQKLKWTAEEEEALLAGVAKHGPGKWKNILKDPEFSDQLSSRSNIDLKDKWRNLSVAPGIQGSKDKIRTPKIKAAAVHLAAVAAAATSTPTPSPNSTQTTFLTRSASDLSMDDSCNIVVDTKNAPRYDGMIFEALLALADANGSDVGAIFNFIEQRHTVLPNFRRILSSRLRRLAAQGKLVKLQNSYKMNDNAMGTRVPSPKLEEVTVQPQQTNNQGPIVSQDMIKRASERAAQLIAEAENKSYEHREAMEEYERMVKLADEYDTFLEIVKEMQEACSLGNTVILGTSTGTTFEWSLE